MGEVVGICIAGVFITGRDELGPPVRGTYVSDLSVQGFSRFGIVVYNAEGTTVEVRDLFFNTPARRKFQRSEKTELAHVDAVLRNLALARCDVAFRLTSNGRAVLTLPAAEGDEAEERRVAAICGDEFMQNARYFSRAIACQPMSRRQKPSGHLMQSTAS